jgi:hypothetical protein
MGSRRLTETGEHVETFEEIIANLKAFFHLSREIKCKRSKLFRRRRRLGTSTKKYFLSLHRTSVKCWLDCVLVSACVRVCERNEKGRRGRTYMKKSLFSLRIGVRLYDRIHIEWYFSPETNMPNLYKVTQKLLFGVRT